MDRVKANEISKKVVEILRKEFPDYKIQPKGGRYGSVHLEMRIELTPPQADGKIVSKEAIAFESFASLYKLNPADLGRKFSYKGTSYTITGLNTRKRQYPICAISEDGRATNFTQETVNLLLTKV